MIDSNFFLFIFFIVFQVHDVNKMDIILDVLTFESHCLIPNSVIVTTTQMIESQWTHQ